MYEMDFDGNVYSLKSGKRKKLSTWSRGSKNYQAVEIDRKQYYVHQLMAITFLDHKINGNTLVVDHINGYCDDNRIENLQVITHGENVYRKPTPDCV